MIEPMRTFLAMLFLATLSAQQPPPPGGGARRPPPEPKNLKVLKVPPSELMPLMRSFTVALGVKCDNCHVQGNFAADDKPAKETARMMITMAQEVNAKFPDGKVHVTCYTCHRGDLEPKTAPEKAAEKPPAE
jgi:Photosynthetic reaction centre cytochrome C subunit